MLLMIDNYDSFTFNISRYFRELGVDVRVIRNDEMTLSQILALAPSQIVISPGPGKPSESGVSRELIQACAGKIPILGVCLGHQCIADVYGGFVVKAERVMHGKTSLVEHNGQGIFNALDQPFHAMRYHSLVVSRMDLPNCFDVVAWSGDEIMGIQHREHPIFGVQFHPESILSEQGHPLFKNFLAQC